MDSGQSLATASDVMKVFIVDDHALFRSALAQLIDLEPELCVVGETGGAGGVIDAIRAAAPDILLMDVVLKRGDGVDLARAIKAQMPALPILVLSMHDNQALAERCLFAGAHGYVRKDESAATLVEAIRRVIRGEVLFDSRQTSGCDSRRANPYGQSAET